MVKQKAKTHRGAAKRLKVTGTGKIVRSKAHKSHLLTKKTRERKRNLKTQVVIDSSNLKMVKRYLPYGG